MSKVEKNKNKTREEILFQAKKLFVQCGYENVKMDDIAKAVNISKTTIYYSYFKSKLDIITIILLEEMEIFLKMVIQFAHIDDPKKSADEIIHNWFFSVKKDNSLWLLVFQIATNKEIMDRIHGRYNEIYREFLRIATGIFEKLGKKRPQITASLLLAHLDGLMFQIFFDHGINVSDEILTNLMEIYGLK